MKVLVIAWHALGKGSGTGIVFSNLLSAIPASNVAQIFGQDTTPAPESCAVSTRLCWRQIWLERVGRRLLGYDNGGARQKTATTIVPPGTIGKGNLLKGMVRAWADLISFKLDAGFWRQIESFGPDVIFTNMGSVRWMNCSLAVSSRLKIPIVPFVNDDWPSTHYARSFTTLVPRFFLLRALNRIMARVPFGIAASEEMALEYTTRYNVPFECILPAVKCSPVPPEGSSTQSAKPIELVYVGGLHLKRYQGLQTIGRAIEKLQAEGLNCQMKIYCPVADSKLLGEQTVVKGASSIGGCLPYDAIPATLAAADILTFVESFDPDLRRYTRLSFSTKIAEYLSSGKPTLSYGPEENASSRYIKKYEVGLVVDTEDLEALTATLRRLVSDAQLRRQLGLNAWRVARENHDGILQRERFGLLLSRAARPKT